MIRCLSSKAGVSPSDEDDDGGWSDAGSLGSGTMTGGRKGIVSCAGMGSCDILGRLSRMGSRQTCRWRDQEGVLTSSIRGSIEESSSAFCIRLDLVKTFDSLQPCPSSFPRLRCPTSSPFIRHDRR